MQEPTEHLRALARRIVEEALERVPLRAALLAGSAGRGDADFYSDIDLLLYVDEIPPGELVEEIRESVGGTRPIRKGEPTDHFFGEEFDLEGVRTEVSFVALAWFDSRLDELVTEIEQFDSSLQKVLSGLLEGLALYGRASSSAGGHAWAPTQSHYGGRWSSGTGPSSRSGTTARRWRRATPSSGGSR